MEVFARRPSLIALTVGTLVAMLLGGALLVVVLRPTPETSKRVVSTAKVEKLQSLLRQLSDQRRLETARAAARSGLPADLIAAVREVEKLSTDSPVYPEASAQAAQWRTQVLALAQARARAASPEALRAAIALATALPGGEEDSLGGAYLRQWRQQLATSAVPAPSTPQMASVGSSRPVPRGAAPSLRIPPESPRELTLQAEQNVDGVSVQVSSVRIEPGGSFRLSMLITNASGQRYVFLPSLIRLEDGSEDNHLDRAELDQERGIIPPGSQARLGLYSRGPWQPPYRLRIEENRSSGQRDFNLSLPQ